MQDVLDIGRRIFIDPTVSSKSTPVPEFKLTHSVSDTDYDDMLSNPHKRNVNFYFKRSAEYFTVKFGALAKNENASDSELPITMLKRFSLAEHSQIVSDHSALYAKNYADLIKIDKAIISSVLLAMILPSVPFIPFVGLVAFAAWGTALYLLSLRANVYNDYQDSLVLLVATCNWSLGSKNRHGSAEELVKAPIISNGKDGMMDLLYPVLSETQVSHLIADDIEKYFTDSLKARDNRYAFFNASNRNSDTSSNSRVSAVIIQELEKTALKKRGAEFIRCIYGLNRGTAPDFLRLLVNAIPDFILAGYNAGKNYFTPETTSTTMSA